jgi:hypothetical protein
MLKILARVSQIGFCVAVTAVIVWFLWDKLGGEPRRDLDAYRRVLAEHVVEDFAGKLPRRDEIRKLVVAPVGRDVDGRVTDLLYDAVEAEELYFLVSMGTVRDAVEDQLGGTEPQSVDEAVQLAEKIKVDDPSVEGVLYTELGHFSDGRRGIGAHVELKGWLVRLETKAPVPGGVVEPTHRRIAGRFDLDWFDATMQEVFWLLRGFVWVLFTAGLPFALTPLVVKVTAMRKNSANWLLLGGLVGASLLLGIALMGFRPGVGGWLLLLVGALCAFVYDFGICDRIDEAQR